MKISLFVFSGTGNTWWTVQKFQSLASLQGISVEIHSIEKINHNDTVFFMKIFKEADILGIAYPIYGSTWPHIMRDFVFHILSLWEEQQSEISSLPPPVLVLTSMMLFSGDGAIVPKQHFEKAGFPFRWAINIPLTSNISIPIFKANPYSKEKIDRNKQKAVPKLEKLIQKIQSNNQWLEHRWNILYRFLAKLQRITEPILYKLVHFSVEHDRCTRCRQCVNYCPTNNIKFNTTTNQVEIGENCTFCMRCYNICPVYAVKAWKKVSLPPKYKRLKPIMEDFSYTDLHNSSTSKS